MIGARICAGVAALAVCAWFALGIRQAQDIAAASALLNRPPHLAAPQAPRGDALLRSAKALNPDLTVNVLQGRVAFLERQHARALRILKDVVRREPMNLQAWLYLAEAALPADIPTLKEATGKIKQLDPKARPLGT